MTMTFGVRVSRFCIYQSHITAELFMTYICVVVPLKLRRHKLALVDNGPGKPQHECLLNSYSHEYSKTGMCRILFLVPFPTEVNKDLLELP